MLHLDRRFLPVYDLIHPGGSNYVGLYNPWLVGTSVIIGILAAYVALSISGRIVAASTTPSRWAWTSAGAVVMGGGIWAMHFVGMLAFSLPCGVTYNLIGTILSVLPGIFACGVALSVISHREQPGLVRLGIGAVLMGAGIGTMHYSGMAAMEAQALLRYDPSWMLVSVVTAVALALMSFIIRFRLVQPQSACFFPTSIASVVMGCAVAGMHYTAMRAALFFPISPGPKLPAMVPPMPLAMVITIFMILITGVTLIACFAARQAELALSLKAEIAERKRGELQLIQARRADTRLVDAIAALNAGIALFDENDRLVVANPTYRHIHEIIADILVPGIQFETILRTNVQRSRFDLGTDEAEAYIQRRLEQHRNPGPVVERRLNDGRWEQVREQRLSDGGLLLIILDVTKEKERESALMRAMNMAEQANRAKTDFLSIMSHELRTPLNAIIGFSDMMLSGVFGPIGSSKYVEYARDVNRSGQLLLEMINDILDLSKIEAGRYELNPQEVSVADIIQDCANVLGAVARQRDIELDCEVDRTLWVLADIRALKQILLNLLSNSLKFTPPGGRVGVAAIAAPDGAVAIAVTDTGIGIGAEDLQTIFEPFRQGHASISRGDKGTGLGLAITKNLVELNGGRLLMQSQEGLGTTVTVWLPMAETSSIVPARISEGATG